MKELSDGSVQMIYTDPPFNTGKVQKRQSIKTTQSSKGSRVGFQGKTYTETKGDIYSYNDSFKDFWGFMEPRLEEMWRILSEEGTLYLHLDYRESHYAKVLMDSMFGRDKFLNEIVWIYDYGGRSKKKWPAKHDTILVYVKDPNQYYFNSEEVDREPYMAPGLVTPEKAAKGKLPTDAWWHTIVPTNGSERTGYATQKPEGIVRRMIQASSKKGDLVFDPFAGSGTLGAVAEKLGRDYILVDQSDQAAEVIQKRLPGITVQ